MEASAIMRNAHHMCIPIMAAVERRKAQAMRREALNIRIPPVMNFLGQNLGMLCYMKPAEDWEEAWNSSRTQTYPQAALLKIGLIWVSMDKNNRSTAKTHQVLMASAMMRGMGGGR